MQQKIVAQQANGIYNPVPAPGPRPGATSPPSFYIPDKPRKVFYRVVNSVMFGTSVRIICLTLMLAAY